MSLVRIVSPNINFDSNFIKKKFRFRLQKEDYSDDEDFLNEQVWVPNSSQLLG